MHTGYLDNTVNCSAPPSEDIGYVIAALCHTVSRD
jgi:hypothetical protein